MNTALNYQPEVLVDTADLSREDWLNYRRLGIGGSDAAAIMGLSPFATIRDLYFDKIGVTPVIEEEEENWVAKEVGHRLEDLVAMIFAKKTGLEVFPVRKMFRHPLYPFMLADVDYFIRFPDGYHRISTKEQHLDRGIIEIKRFCENQKIKLESIFTDKITGKNFDRPRYTVLVEDVLRVGDTLIITELDRLGRNKQEILKQLRFLEEKGVRVMVLELPTTLFDLSQMENNLAKMMIETINNMMIELYASMAQAEMEKKEKRQKEGMEAKRLRGEWDEVGRPRAIEQEKFNQEFMRVVQKKVTPTQLQRELRLTSSTYYRYRKNFYENFPEFLQSV